MSNDRGMVFRDWPGQLLVIICIFTVGHNICVSNTDDHLRNHGFLLTDNGWILSPAYDMNPNETGTGLKLNISEYDNSLDLCLPMEVVKYFRLTHGRATQIIETVKKSVNGWKRIAEKYNITKTDQEIMSKAFLAE